jgi:hypothetical protein
MKGLFLLIVLFVFLDSPSLFAQKKVITGTVTSTDEGEAPVSGVTVFAKGSSRGTTTDNNGHSSLKVPAKVTALVFTCNGMKKQEVEIAGMTLGIL